MNTNYRQQYDVIVIGAGAAGLFYAAMDEMPGKKLILEKTARPGQKILMSGAGACNLTHGGSIKDFIGKYGPNGKKIRGCLFKYNNEELQKKMKGWGLSLTEREDGKVFPRSMKAGDVLDVLLSHAKNYELRTNSEVVALEDDFLVLQDGSRFFFDKLIIACGGASYPLTGSDGSFMTILKDKGIETVDLKPALSPIYVHDYGFGNISGVSIPKVVLSLGKVKVSGPLLFTHKNFSGPAALHMSQYVKTGDKLHFHFVPDWNKEEVMQFLKTAREKEAKSVVNYLSAVFALPKSFVEHLWESPSQRMMDLNNRELNRLCEQLCSFESTVSGLGSWNEAMVTAGGVALSEVDLTTMRIKKYPKMHIIGEALDINGDTGGYNLQFAYSSAMAALYSEKV